MNHQIPVKKIPVKQIHSSRKITLHILRYNPQEPAEASYIQPFIIEEVEGMTLFIALSEIREQHDHSLQFDFVCRAGICGSCAMLINGKPALACRTLTKDLPDNIHLAPLPGFELIGDLSVNTGKWMRGMSEKLQTWIHAKESEINICTLEDPMDPEKAESIYELERCIECGCCIAACGTVQMKESFIGAVGINQIARFHIDPRDTRTVNDLYQLIGDENGVFGCMTLLGCDDMCPKNLPLAQQIAYMRRKMAALA